MPIKDAFFLVILDKGRESQVYQHTDARAAERRAEALADLHSTTYQLDRNGDYYIDATDWYQSQHTERLAP